jgi:hypothetical protein
MVCVRERTIPTVVSKFGKWLVQITAFLHKFSWGQWICWDVTLNCVTVVFQFIIHNNSTCCSMLKCENVNLNHETFNHVMVPCIHSFSFYWRCIYFPTSKIFSSSVLMGITPCSPMKMNCRFGGTCQLKLRSRSISQGRAQIEAYRKQRLSHAGFLHFLPFGSCLFLETSAFSGLRCVMP